MRRTRDPARLLALVLALILAFSLAAVPALAEEQNPTDGENTGPASNAENGENGENGESGGSPSAGPVTAEASASHDQYAFFSSVGSADSPVSGTGVTASASDGGTALVYIETIGSSTATDGEVHAKADHIRVSVMPGALNFLF